MKRIQLIAAALCLIMLTTAGAGAVAAKQDDNPRQAGASQIYFYNVQATDSHGTGKLMINAKQGTFVFNGKGFSPDMTYTLIDRTTSSGIHVLATGKSTAAGNLHLTGTWEKGAALPGAAAVSVTPVLAVTIRAASSLSLAGDTVTTTFSAVVTSGNPVRYIFVRDDVGVVLYDGGDPNLGGASFSYPYAPSAPHVTLTAFDSAGHTATAYWP